MRQSTIVKICEIPIVFSRGHKSAFDLAFGSGFIFSRKRKVLYQLKNYLETRDSLLKWWQQWSDDKRVNRGYYLKLEEMNIVGYYDSAKGGIMKEVEYKTAIDACSEFILLETASILNITINNKKIDNLKWDVKTQ
jgi:hypothetical protein